jgi:hypothetical protein
MPDAPQSVVAASTSATAREAEAKVSMTSEGLPCCTGCDGSVLAVAVIDVAGFVADLKSQAIDFGFHVHDERHFVETY